MVYHLNYDNLCDKNTCTCENGTEAKDSDCLEHEDHVCKNCQDGYGLTKGLKCKITTCECEKGIPEIGTDCPKQGEVLCKTCDEDFFKDSKKNCKKFLPYKLHYADGTNLNLPQGFSPNGCCFYIQPKQNYPKFERGQKLLVVDSPNISPVIKQMKWTIVEANPHIGSKEIINYKLCAIDNTNYLGRSDPDNSCFVYDDDLKALEQGQTDEKD